MEPHAKLSSMKGRGDFLKDLPRIDPLQKDSTEEDDPSIVMR